MKQILLALSLTALLGSCAKKEVVAPCYTCTSFVTYSSDLATFVPPNPYTKDKEVCAEADKVKLEKGEVKVEKITGVYSLSTITRTVCYKKAI